MIELARVQRATERERKRSRSYQSAQKGVDMFRDDLHSEKAEELHRKLRDRGSPTINDIREDLEKLAGELGVSSGRSACQAGESKRQQGGVGRGGGSIRTGAGDS